MTHNQIDHLLFGAPDLELGIQTIQDRLGVQAACGGQHPGVGTHNALVSLGPGTYLEIIAPDPQQDVPAVRIPYGLGSLQAPCLITWALRPHSWSTYLAQLKTLGIDNQVQTRSRTRPDGEQLRWRSTKLQMPTKVDQADLTGLIPFAIDWQTPSHPSTTAPGELELKSLTLQSPDLNQLQHAAATLDLPVRTEQADKPGMVAMIGTPAGIVLLL